MPSSSSGESLSYNAAHEFADANGLIVVPRSNYELQIDIDQPFESGADINERVLEVIQQRYALRDRTRLRSKSGNTHVVLRFHDYISAFEALVFQATLGSDPVRETLGVFRVNDNEQYASMLFRPDPDKPQNKETPSDLYGGLSPQQVGRDLTINAFNKAVDAANRGIKAEQELQQIKKACTGNCAGCKQ